MNSVAVLRFWPLNVREKRKRPYLRFEVQTAVNVKIMVFCNVTQYCSVDRHNFAEEPSASIFREMEVESSSELLVPIYKITRRHILGDRSHKSVVIQLLVMWVVVAA
jgi:hypothetical protein